MNLSEQEPSNNVHNENMLRVIAELFEKEGAEDRQYSTKQKATDILEVLSTLLAYTIYNSCPGSDAIRDASEASYFQIKQTALAYFYEQQKQEAPKKSPSTSRSPFRKF